MDRVRKLKLVLWAITGLGAAVGLTRFFFGLGATTNLTDSVPWGIWIGFDVMSGVALAAGGFVMTATVYIFGKEEFHPIVRPAVLTAFLGYVAVAFGLLFDLGLPWNIWHMIIFWNHHSPLFEVGWCVMLYLTVLLLEFSPVPMEDVSAFARIRRFLVKLRLPLVITGIALSTLHQSSLGSLFMIMPYRVHPLWYSNILPIMFFISAVGLGLMMVTFESHFTSYFYRRKPEFDLLEKLTKAARWVLLLYLVVRISDIAVRGHLADMFAPGWRTWWFWFELTVMVIAPVIMFSIPAVHKSRAGQWTAGTLGVSGVVINRINVGGFTHLDRGSEMYLPAWSELSITLAVIAIMALVFMFFLERFKVWEERPHDPLEDEKSLPEFDPASGVTLGAPSVAARYSYTLAFVVAAGIGFGLLSNRIVHAEGSYPSPVHEARGGESLWIDGNRDGFGVEFSHDAHIENAMLSIYNDMQSAYGQESAEGEALQMASIETSNIPDSYLDIPQDQSCARCHHMNMPGDENSGCYNCHSDMYSVTDAFRHDWHASPAGGNLSCSDCHTEGMAKNAVSSYKTCDDCHEGELFMESPSPVNYFTIHFHNEYPGDAYQAQGYAETMHRLCITCHVNEAEHVGIDDLARCTTCHTEIDREFVTTDLPSLEHHLEGKRLIIPSYAVENPTGNE